MKYFRVPFKVLLSTATLMLSCQMTLNSTEDLQNFIYTHDICIYDFFFGGGGLHVTFIEQFGYFYF